LPFLHALCDQIFIDCAINLFCLGSMPLLAQAGDYNPSKLKETLTAAKQQLQGELK
jgi:hypothetical protein